MEINGVPLHPLVVHAAAVFVPLAALAGVIYALVPKWRWLFRHPTLGLAAIAALSVQFAGMTGENLKEDRGLQSALIETHETWAGRLTFGIWVFAATAVVGWWVLPHVTALVKGSDKDARFPYLVMPVTVLLPLMAVAVMVLVYFTGDSGAKAVWG